MEEVRPVMPDAGHDVGFGDHAWGFWIFQRWWAVTSFDLGGGGDEWWVRGVHRLLR